MKTMIQLIAAPTASGTLEKGDPGERYGKRPEAVVFAIGDLFCSVANGLCFCR